MVINRSHLSWAIFTVLATIALGLAYMGYAHSESFPWIAWGERPSYGGMGSTPLGLGYGIAAGLIFLFAAALGMRKRRPFRWLARSALWMRAHIWLTLLTVPLVVFHAGFKAGGPMTQTLLWLNAIVMVSGLVGLRLQHRLPTQMKEQLPGEVVFEEIPHLIRLSFERLLVLKLYLQGGKNVDVYYRNTISPEMLALKEDLFGQANTPERVSERITSLLAVRVDAPADAVGLRSDGGVQVAQEPRTTKVDTLLKLRQSWDATNRTNREDLLRFVSFRLVPVLEKSGTAFEAKAAEARRIQEVLENQLAARAVVEFLDSSVLPYFADKEIARYYYPSLKQHHEDLRRLATHCGRYVHLPAEASREHIRSAREVTDFFAKEAVPYLSGEDDGLMNHPAKLRQRLDGLAEAFPESKRYLDEVFRWCDQRHTRDVEAARYHGSNGKARKQLSNASAAANAFRTLRATASSAFQSEVNRIQAMTDDRRRFDMQTNMQRRLHSWLLLHIPVSFILIILTAWHVVVTLFQY